MDRREKAMENFDVYEYDILSKREDLLRNVINQKVNQMIRYGLEPKGNRCVNSQSPTVFICRFRWRLVNNSKF